MGPGTTTMSATLVARPTASPAMVCAAVDRTANPPEERQSCLILARLEVACGRFTCGSDLTSP
jgi:hypothetical protein